ncbi:hypothetical protein FRX31_019479 [Thalictrum thalictroides]|uniref:Uncharacterized protein n=1 Tax=Thalictrum thalictroides TaxID=46969 RepID=A0A7J6W1G6_THATH|nr:hypothetical protein FRX31_019479 [Thalictrum thalictroides]
MWGEQRDDEGSGLCDECANTYTFKDILVSQVPTGKQIEGKTEYKVTLKNPCICTQLSITLSCPGFNTVEAIDPTILTHDGDTCGVEYIHRFEQVEFTYAWDTAITFTPVSSQIACSK